jgi:transitional endoplasmic reticulum ATPase
VQFIAKQTHGFSGADSGFITQRAAKLATKGAHRPAILSVPRLARPLMKMLMSRPGCPELTKAYFNKEEEEEAMRQARRSVTDVGIRWYEAFAQSMKNAGPGPFLPRCHGYCSGGPEW